ncbi:heme-degrading monooxygenase HmoA [Paenibacillus endophyticus]|uniref:Heme-degrading monooxygenase HmoA n=1 Tax=Paenibacillus endophyticus TaxID=1294268 RepID=A0A7W5GDW2_9BACL|nr:Dabb family protein [Paenibacillus endophyticus]MBB3155888.1 heme-degrading monooxygenase HmoA [Paenibacillus endophyticus]
MNNESIHHMIIFSLQHEAGSEAAEAFMRDAEHQLTKIPGVKQFRAFRLKPNNHMDYGISMVFDSQEDYAAYASHPLHDDFENLRWKREATRAMVIDYDY